MNKPSATLPAPPHETSVYLGELKEQLDRIEQMLQRTAAGHDRPTLTQREAMQMLGYRDRESFVKRAKALGIPYCPTSSRRRLFLRSDIEAVLRQRQVGTGRRRAA